MSEPDGNQRRGGGWAMVPDALIDDPALSAVDLRVYARLARLCGSRGWWQIGQDRLAATVHDRGHEGVSVITLQRSLGRLEETRWVYAVPQRFNGNNGWAVYHVARECPGCWYVGSRTPSSEQHRVGAVQQHRVDAVAVRESPSVRESPNATSASPSAKRGKVDRDLISTLVAEARDRVTASTLTELCNAATRWTFATACDDATASIEIALTHWELDYEYEHVREYFSDALSDALERVRDGRSRTPSDVGRRISKYLAEQHDDAPVAWGIHDEVVGALAHIFKWRQADNVGGA